MKRWLGLFGILALMVGVAIVWLHHTQIQTRESHRLARVHEGMTTADVIEIMGEPTDEDDHYTDAVVLVWVSQADERLFYVVELDKKGVVRETRKIQGKEPYDPCLPNAKDKGTSKLAKKCKTMRDSKKWW